MGAATWAQTTVSGSLSITERYDSNVFLASRSVAGNRDLWDVVSTTSPTITVKHSGRAVEGNLNVGGSGNVYVNNPELNFFSTRAGLNLNLDGLAGKFVKGMKMAVSDNFLYTPEPPAFLTPQVQEGESEGFRIGIQAFRANSFRNTARATVSIPLTPRSVLDLSYTNAISRFGSSRGITAPSGGFFGTTTHTAGIEPQWQLSARDSIAVNYQFVNARFSGGRSGSFSTHSLSAVYGRQLTPTLSLSLSGGGTVLDTNDELFFTGRGALTRQLRERTSATLAYSRGVRPSFFLENTALVSQTLNASLAHQLSARLSVSGAVNYALNESPSSDLIRFESYGTSINWGYQLTRTMSAALSYGFNRFETKSGQTQFEFDRHIVTLGVQAVFN